MTTRRQLLQGTAATAAFFAATSFVRTAAADAPKLRPLPKGTILEAPNFALKPEYTAGIRPHRKGGVRLTRHGPIDTPNGKKFLIHNYGHSGAGITLSWGCASCVVDHVEAVMKEMDGMGLRPSVAVLGTGIIGLTSATELRRKWSRLPITVYAKSLDITKTTSFIAGGQFEPSQIYREYDTDEGKKTLADYLTRSATRITELNNSGRRDDFGIAIRRNFTFAPSEPLDDFTPRDVVGRPTPMKLPFKHLSADGFEYITWLMNPKPLMRTLVDELKGGKVLFQTKTFDSEQQINADLKETIIVNCTGYGAKKLFKDPDLHPRRGHLVILPNPGRLKYFIGGGCNDAIFYLFARQTDIVIGGTVIHNDDDEREFFDEADPRDKAIVDRILKNAKVFFAGQQDQCVEPQDAVAANL